MHSFIFVHLLNVILYFRSNSQQQNSLDKYKKSAEDAKNKSDFLDTQLSALKKVCCVKLELELFRKKQRWNISLFAYTCNILFAYFYRSSPVYWFYLLYIYTAYCLSTNSLSACCMLLASQSISEHPCIWLILWL